MEYIINVSQPPYLYCSIVRCIWHWSGLSQRTRYPHLDLLQLRLKAESLARVNRRERSENARLGAQVRTVKDTVT